MHSIGKGKRGGKWEGKDSARCQLATYKPLFFKSLAREKYVIDVFQKYPSGGVIPVKSFMTLSEAECVI